MCILSKNMHHFIADSGNLNFMIIPFLIEGGKNVHKLIKSV